MKFSILLLFLITVSTKSIAGFSVRLDQVLKHTLHFSEQSKIIEGQLDIELEQNRVPLGSFDFKLNSELSHNYADIPPTSPFGPQKLEQNNFQVSISKSLPYGMTMALTKSLIGNKEHFGGGTEIRTKDTELGFQWEINLLKNFLGRSDRRIYENANIQNIISNLRYTVSVQSLLYDVSAAVMKAGALEKRKQVQARRCETLEKFNQLVLKRFKSQLVEKKDYLLSNALFQSCQTVQKNVTLEYNFLRQQIKSYLGVKQELDHNFSWPDSLIRFRWKLPKGSDYHQLDRRPSLKLLKKVMEANKIGVARARDGKNPTLKLTLGTALSGSRDSVKHSYTDISHGKHPSHSIGFKFSMPINRTTEKAEFRAAQYSLLKTQYTLKQHYRELRDRFDNLLQDLNQRLLNVQKFEEITKGQKERFEIVKRDFEQGRINTQDLLDASNDLTASLENKINAKYQFYLKELEYLLTIGDLERLLE